MLGRPLDAVLEITAPIEEVVRRLLLRAAEQGRSDDTEEVDSASARGLRRADGPAGRWRIGTGACSREVDGIGSVDEVTARLLGRARPGCRSAP